MNVAELICKKRDGQTLTPPEIDFLIQGFVNDQVPDYQMSAFAMAVYFQGMTPDETVSLTRSVIESGIQMNWPNGKPKVDKHSTGGIGDKVSIPLAPMLACCGVDVPMVSGRGLGATGGTLDKLESIRGFRCDLGTDEFRSVVNWNGCAIVSASDDLAPADKRMYALRDVTGTIPSIPLITASILSKKVAEGIDALVLDVKWGSGAFMKSQEQARQLAESLVAVGNQLGVKTSAMITDMNQPLGRMIGNGVEIDESLEILDGRGPNDVVELTLALGAQLLCDAGVAKDEAAARKQLQNSIDTGAAMDRLGEMVKSQHGDINAKRVRATMHVVEAHETGYVSRVNSERLGLAVIEMGGGRKQMGDEIDHSVGIEFLVRIGDSIEAKQPIARIYCEPKIAAYASELVGLSLGVQPHPVEPPDLIVDVIRS